jgi:hypothetical protein
VTNTIKETSIGRLDVKIIHGFIEGNVLGRFDSLRYGIKIQNVLQCLGVAKKNANPSIGDKLIGATRTSGEGIDTTPKDTEQAKIRLVTGAELKRGGGLIAMNGNIVEAKPVVEGIRPEFWR